MGPVVLKHWPVNGDEPTEVHGTYQNGTHCLDGLIDPKTRTFEGTGGNCGRPWARVRFVLSEDGERIQGRYAQDLTSTELTMLWDMRRSPAVTKADSPGTITLPFPNGQPFDWLEAGRRHTPGVILPTGLSTSLDLNGDWDSRWQKVTFSHDPVKTGDTAIDVKGTYYNGNGKIEGTLNIGKRTFEGRFSEANGMNGPIRFVVADHGETIKGVYAYRQDSTLADPTELNYEWDMTRKLPPPVAPVSDPAIATPTTTAD